MATKQKSWQEKLCQAKGLPKIVKLSGKAATGWGGARMVVPSPLEVDAVMKKVPQGKLATIAEIRATLAKKFKTDIACPLTSGIFTWIAANAAEEQRQQGKKNLTPWWRTLKTGGELNPKYPGGIINQKKLLAKEGHKIIQKGQRYFVADFEKSLAKV
jgi:hypothetical protein